MSGEQNKLRRAAPLPGRGPSAPGELPTTGQVRGRPRPSRPASSAAALLAASGSARPSGSGRPGLPSPHQWSLQRFSPSEVGWASPLGSRAAGRRLSLAQPAARTVAGSSFNADSRAVGGLHSVGKGLQRHHGQPGEEHLTESRSDLASLPFVSIPHPEAEWSPGQSTKWLFATKHLEMPEGGSWPSVSPGSHTVIQSHTQRLRRLCQQAWQTGPSFSLSTCRG